MKDKNRYLITGASGFIGSKLVAFLSKNRCNLRFLSRNSQYDDTIQCDLLTDSIPQDALSDINTVFHLAGFAHDTGDASKIVDIYYKLNVSATVQLANLAAKMGVKKFVFVSSVKAGGNINPNKCADENDLGDPEGIYGETKREAELKLLEIGKETNMHISIIRPSLVYGPNMKGNLKLMLSGIEKGWFPPLPETGNRRSMIHVDDLVSAILLVAENDQANGEIFIATDGTPYSSREIYNAMCTVRGKVIPKWSVPKILLELLSLANTRIKYMIIKLLGNKCYSSAKLEALGFKAKKTLKDMNETDF